MDKKFVISMTFILISNLLLGFWVGWSSRGDYEKQKALHPQPTKQDIQAKVYNPEERIGGGYRNGKFVYLKDLK